MGQEPIAAVSRFSPSTSLPHGPVALSIAMLVYAWPSASEFVM